MVCSELPISLRSLAPPTAAHSSTSFLHAVLAPSPAYQGSPYWARSASHPARSPRRMMMPAAAMVAFQGASPPPSSSALATVVTLVYPMGLPPLGGTIK